MDIAYDLWNDDNFKEVDSYDTMVDYMRKNYGDDCALALF